MATSRRRTGTGGGALSRPAHMLAVDLGETVFEPRVDGHVYDRGVDGRECR